MDYEVAVIGDIDSPAEAIRSLLHTTLNHVAVTFLKTKGGKKVIVKKT